MAQTLDLIPWPPDASPIYAAPAVLIPLEPKKTMLAGVKEHLYHPCLPTLRRMDMDTVANRLTDQHSRTSTTCSKEDFQRATFTVAGVPSRPVPSLGMSELRQSLVGRYRAGKLAPLPPSTNQEEWPSYTRAMQDWSRFVSAAGELALPSHQGKGRAAGSAQLPGTFRRGHSWLQLLCRQILKARRHSNLEVLPQSESQPGSIRTKASSLQHSEHLQELWNCPQPLSLSGALALRSRSVRRPEAGMSLCAAFGHPETIKATSCLKRRRGRGRHLPGRQIMFSALCFKFQGGRQRGKASGSFLQAPPGPPGVMRRSIPRIKAPPETS